MPESEEDTGWEGARGTDPARSFHVTGERGPEAL